MVERTLLLRAVEVAPHLHTDTPPLLFNLL